MDPVQELVELEALRRLKATYFYCVDMKDMEGWLALWVPDGTFQWEHASSAGGQDGKPGRIYRGKDLSLIFTEIANFAQTVHIGHSPLLDVISESEARGIWGMEDIVDLPNQSMHAYGHYHETYRKIEGKWKFSTVYLKRLRVALTSR